MNLKGITSGYGFARNPLIVESGFDAPDWRGVPMTVSLGGADIYEARLSTPFSIDISEIVDAHIEFFDEPENIGADPIHEIVSSGDMFRLGVTAKCTYGEDEEEISFTAIPGGVSKQNFRRMTQKDIFEARLLNTANNFFMTTRTKGWRIIIKETELYPLYFIYSGATPANVSAVECVSRGTMDLGNISAGVYALDIEGLRRKAADDLQVISNIFDIYVDNTYSCRIVVERTDISKERYRLKFRNSLGVFEIIEITGELSISSEYPQADETKFLRYDPSVNDFNYDRGRMPRSQSIEVKTGMKRVEEIHHLMDMISSEEVYLLDLTELPARVIPSVDSLTYRPRQTAPTQFTLKLEPVESETNIMQEIIDGSEGRKPRVFSKQFSKQFN